MPADRKAFPRASSKYVVAPMNTCRRFTPAGSLRPESVDRVGDKNANAEYDQANNCDLK